MVSIARNGSNAAGRFQDEGLEDVPHQKRKNWRENKVLSISMPECLVPGLCAEDDCVTLQRNSRFLKQNDLDATTRPPPRKFCQASKSLTCMPRSRSVGHLCAWANARLEHQGHNENKLCRSSDPSSWIRASMCSNIMEDDSQLLRPPSLAVIWESLMTKSDVPGHTTVELSHSDALAETMSSPRAQPASRTDPCSQRAAGDERAREAACRRSGAA